MLLTLVLAFGCIFASVQAIIPQGCTVHINRDLPKGAHHPLYFHAGSMKYVTTIPDTFNIRLDEGEQIDLYCNGGFKFRDLQGTNQLTATCIRGQNFGIIGRMIPLGVMTCLNEFHSTTFDTGRKCAAGDVGTIIEIGFEVHGVHGPSWAPLLEVCYDIPHLSAKWSHNLMKTPNSKKQSSQTRPPFVDSGNYGGSPTLLDNSYTVRRQLAAIATILDSVQLANKIIHEEKVVMSRGHLTPRSDQVFLNQQEATMQVLNLVPHLTTANNLNWERLETWSRIFLQLLGVEADVYTGAFGSFKYPNTKNVLKALYLLPASNKNPLDRLPVPLYLYKVLIADSIESGIAFIGINNPLLSEEDIHKHILCEDVSEKAPYIEWHISRTNLRSGYVYACTLENFLKVVEDLPETVRPYKDLLH